MFILFLLSMLWASSCVAMEHVSAKVLDNDVLVQELFKAIRRNEPLVVESMITEYPHLMHSYGKMSDSVNDRVSGLHVAAAEGYNACIKTLLECKADPNIITRDKQDTPLHHVQNPKGTQLLLLFGAHADQENAYGRTPLYNALFFEKLEPTHMNTKVRTRKDQENIARLLIEAGASLSKRDKKENNLVHQAVQLRCASVVDFLLCNNVHAAYERNCFGLTPFDEALESQNNNHILRVFEKHGIFFFSHISPVELFRTPSGKLETGAAGTEFLNNWARVFAFVNEKKLAGRQGHESGDIPTSFGVICNQYGCIIKDISWRDLEQFFTPPGAKMIKADLMMHCQEAASFVRADNHLALKNKITFFPFVITYDHALAMNMVKEAVQNHYVNCLEVLLKHTVGSNEMVSPWRLNARIDDGTLLHLAVLCGSAQAIKLLMNCNADCLVVNAEGRTPIEYAVKLKRNDCTKQLNKLISEQFLVAFDAGNYKKSKQLLAQMVDCNILDRWGNALLHRMMLSPNNKTKTFIDLLVKKGANPNLRNKKGESPLWVLWAHHAEKIDIFEALLKVGADVNMHCTNTNRSLLDVAVHREKMRLVNLFLLHGAIVSKGI